MVNSILKKFAVLFLTFTLLPWHSYVQAAGGSGIHYVAANPQTAGKTENDFSNALDAYVEKAMQKALENEFAYIPSFESVKDSLREGRANVSDETLRLEYDVHKEAMLNDHQEVKDAALYMAKLNYSMDSELKHLRVKYADSDKICVDEEEQDCYSYHNFMQGALRAYVNNYIKETGKRAFHGEKISPQELKGKDIQGWKDTLTHSVSVWDAEKMLTGMPQIERIISDSGWHPNDTNLLVKYFKFLVEKTGDFCKNDFHLVNVMPGLLATDISGKSTGRKSEADNADAARQQQCSNVMRAMTLLGIVAPAGQKDENAAIVFKALQDNYKKDYGAMVINSAMAALVAFGTKASYGYIEKFLNNELAPEGSVWKTLRSLGGEILGILSIEEWAAKGIGATNRARGGGGRYLNYKSQQYQYIDTETARAYGISDVSIDAMQKTPSLGYNIPYGNTMEDIGALLATTGTQEGNALATKILSKYVAAEGKRAECVAELIKGGDVVQKMAVLIAVSQKCDAAVTTNLPLVAGILKHTTSKGFAAQQAAKYFNSLDWWDLNEATQRRINNIPVANPAFSDMVKNNLDIRKYINKDFKEGELEERGYNDAKAARASANKKIQSLGFWADIAVIAIFMAALLKSMPQLVSKMSSFMRNVKRIRALSKAEGGSKMALYRTIKGNRKALGIKTPQELRALKDDLQALRFERNKALKTQAKLEGAQQTAKTADKLKKTGANIARIEEETKVARTVYQTQLAATNEARALEATVKAAEDAARLQAPAETTQGVGKTAQTTAKTAEAAQTAAKQTQQTVKATETVAPEKAFTPKQQQAVDRWQRAANNFNSVEKDLKEMNWFQRNVTQRTKQFALEQKKQALQRELVAAQDGLAQNGLKLGKDGLPVIAQPKVVKPFAEGVIAEDGQAIDFNKIGKRLLSERGENSPRIRKIDSSSVSYSYEGKTITLTQEQQVLYDQFKIKNPLFEKSQQLLVDPNLTPAARANILQAQSDLSKVDTFYDNPLFRQIESVLNSPSATDRALFVSGLDLEGAPKAKGFLAKFIGNSSKGVTKAEFTDAFKAGAEAGDDFFLHMHAHGRINPSGWYSPLSATENITAQEIINAARSNVTGKGKVFNLYADNCNMGTAFGDITKSFSKQELNNIRIWAEAGGNRQLNVVSGGFEPTFVKAGKNMDASLWENLVYRINDPHSPNIGVKVLYNGETINPLRSSIEAARQAGNTQMTNELTAIYRVMEANSDAGLRKALTDLGKAFEGKDGFFLRTGDNVTNFSFADIDVSGVINGKWAQVALPQEHFDFVANVAKNMKTPWGGGAGAQNTVKATTTVVAETAKGTDGVKTATQGVKTAQQELQEMNWLQRNVTQRGKAQGLEAEVKATQTAQQELKEMNWLQRNVTQRGKAQQLEADIKTFNSKEEKLLDDVSKLMYEKQFDKAVDLQKGFIDELLNSNVVALEQKENIAWYFNEFMHTRRGFMAELSQEHYIVMTQNNISGLKEGNSIAFYLNGYNLPAAEKGWLTVSPGSTLGTVIIPIGSKETGFTLKELIRTVQEMPYVGENPIFISGVHGHHNFASGLHMGTISKGQGVSVNIFAETVGSAVKGKANKAFIFYEDCFGGLAFEEYMPVKGVELITIAPSNGINIVYTDAFFMKNPYMTMQNRMVNNGFITAKYTVNGVKHYPLRQAVIEAQKLTGSYGGVSAKQLQDELKALNNLFELPLETPFGVSNERLIQKAVSDLPKTIQRHGTGKYIQIEHTQAGFIEAVKASDPEYTVIHIPEYISHYVSSTMAPTIPTELGTARVAAAGPLVSSTPPAKI